MKLFDANDYSGGYSYFYEGGTLVNDFPLKVNLVSIAEDKLEDDWQLYISIDERDKNWMNSHLDDETVNNYYNYINNSLKTKYGFKNELINSLSKSVKAPKKTIEDGKNIINVGDIEDYIDSIEKDLEENLNETIEKDRWDYEGIDVGEINGIFYQISDSEEIPYKLRLLSSKMLCIKNGWRETNKSQAYKKVEMRQGLKNRDEVWNFAKELIIKEGALLRDEAYKNYNDATNIVDKLNFAKEWQERCGIITDSLDEINDLQKRDELFHEKALIKEEEEQG